MKTPQKNLQVLSVPEDSHTPVKLTKVVPKGWIQVAFWALRIYILVMVVLVAIGFSRGIH
ncbi:hypothetical protein [Sulfobacillus sp. hq2]|uniref:Uncharacterized protein n=1 Tax=Sulfobacillus thermotolerans TaxID=338644 RepID=A0ABM6RUV6_9FIRM|nr:hypothetical protein [Sulfobacillus sp. hq2]AUW95122.1 hypothetical protein BXT84_15135 [Sulfobacillus thermotolerans]MCY0909561.1 hypothetical protein [Sulfobacillus thermotolerans]POB10267.1 hypothetical protein CO251_09925 [Sulfobacillus sp. hq2]